ncbi:hypothetical protein [Pseudomonas moorei]|uniref:hypothetical protein n=1 Tax=Pseudomonas moorei TaxID=395599 RepID=UPI001FF175A0|nr:hypothetical protein [Pseudomonas moorei]
MRVITRGFAILVSMTLAACFGNPPYHAVEPRGPSPDDCAKVYEVFDNAIEGVDGPGKCGSINGVDRDANDLSNCLASMVDKTTPGGINNLCWHAPSEHHSEYDLFFTEFDDQGWEADLRQDPRTRTTEIDNLFTQLTALAKTKHLDVVIYTHGWHGSSDSDNYYTVLFRDFLQTLAKLDGADRHVVGIYVGWRGDSIKFPSKYLSVWDRKVAAETVSAGAVQGLFEHLHNFYLDNSCHPSGKDSLSGKKESCGKVHMLTIGHSFGALINFRSLLGNMESGLITPPSSRVYSFGDLVVLLNPAFEGTRYAPLYNSAVRRPAYLGLGNEIGGVQLPVIVTLQSQGDWATGDFFPVFRHVTTVGSNLKCPEKSANDQALPCPEKSESAHAMGWVSEFATHKLCLAPYAKSPNFAEGKHPKSICDETFAKGDECDTTLPNVPIEMWLTCRLKKWAPDGTQSVNAFSVLGSKEPIYMGEGMTLAAVPPEHGETRPDYFPYWVVKVDKSIMYDHDDVWNPLTTQLILKLYHAVVTQSEIISTQAINKKNDEQKK